MNNPKFNDYIYVIYPKELEIKDTTDYPKWANYLDHLEFDEDGKLFTRLYDKRDDFDFPIFNLPFLGSNIQNPVHMVFLFHSRYVMACYAQVCSKYEDFLFRGYIVPKLLKQGYASRKLHSTFRKLYGRHTDLVHKFDSSLSHMLNGLFSNCDI